MYLSELDIGSATGVKLKDTEARSGVSTNAGNIGVLSQLVTDDKSNLVNSINETNGRIDLTVTAIQTNAGNIATNTANIGTLSNLKTQDKTSLVAAVNEVATTVIRGQNPKYVILSDSYGLTPSNVDNWIVDFCAYMGLTVGTDAFVYSEGGASFGGTSGYPLFEDMVDDISIVGAHTGEITHVICCGGYNDIPGVGHGATTVTTKAGIATFATNAKTRFPNAEIYVGFIGSTWDGSLRAALALAIDDYISACATNDIHYLNNVEHAMYLDSFFQGDKIHPYTAGAASIGTAVSQAIRTGSADVNTSYKNATFTARTGVAMSTFNYPVASKVDNGLMQVNFFYNADTTQFAFSPAVDIANEIELGSISDTHVCGDSFGTLSTLVMCDAGGTNYLSNVPAQLSVRDGKLYIKIFGTLTDMNGLLIKGRYAVGVSQIEQ